MKTLFDQFVGKKEVELETAHRKSKKFYSTEKVLDALDVVFGPGTGTRYAKYEDVRFKLLYDQAVQRDRSGGMDIDAQDYRSDAKSYAFELIMEEEYAKI